MAQHLRVEETTYTIQWPINASSLGRRLGEAGLDVQRLALAIFIRVVILAAAAYIWWWRGDLEIATVTGKVVLVICFIFLLYPLRHCKDSMQFYENGIVYRGQGLHFSDGQGDLEQEQRNGIFSVWAPALFGWHPQ